MTVRGYDAALESGLSRYDDADDDYDDDDTR